MRSLHKTFIYIWMLLLLFSGIIQAAKNSQTLGVMERRAFRVKTYFLTTAIALHNAKDPDAVQYVLKQTGDYKDIFHFFSEGYKSLPQLIDLAKKEKRIGKVTNNQQVEATDLRNLRKVVEYLDITLLASEARKKDFVIRLIPEIREEVLRDLEMTREYYQILQPEINRIAGKNLDADLRSKFPKYIADLDKTIKAWKIVDPLNLEATVKNFVA
ncbi:hypothetical protein H072_8820 [Dactylellina haptotyla CBS 200.50]|uniref:Uncharacterized protein n=1 Tax=Dactylellina haptotyla (strain CBS 200.50) TaxID=1284197 RepID=S8A3Z5_DACHA|nr:hypothetical protein H072_8820 [Dactylellina haptotyla CBS 200.50]